MKDWCITYQVDHLVLQKRIQAEDSIKAWEEAERILNEQDSLRGILCVRELPEVVA